MWDVESGNVKCVLRMRNDEWPCGVLGVSHRGHRATQMPCGMIGQTTDRTAGAADRHRFFAGGVNLHLQT